VYLTAMETLMMSVKERRRLAVLDQVKTGDLTRQAAAARLCVPVRLRARRASMPVRMRTSADRSDGRGARRWWRV